VSATKNNEIILVSTVKKTKTTPQVVIQESVKKNIGKTVFEDQFFECTIYVCLLKTYCHTKISTFL
jgi:hypothetical protein